jgi:hypothetical protein
LSHAADFGNIPSGAGIVKFIYFSALI